MEQFRNLRIVKGKPLEKTIELGSGQVEGARNLILGGDAAVNKEVDTAAVSFMLNGV